MSYRDWEEDPRNRRGRHSAPDSWVASDETYAGQPRRDGGRGRYSGYGDPAGAEDSGGRSRTYGSAAPFGPPAEPRGWSPPDRLDDTGEWTRAAHTGEWQRPDEGWPARPEPDSVPPDLARPPLGANPDPAQTSRSSGGPRDGWPGREEPPYGRRRARAQDGYEPRSPGRRALPSAEPPSPAIPTSSGAYAGELLPPGRSPATPPSRRDRFGSSSDRAYPGPSYGDSTYPGASSPYPTVGSPYPDVPPGGSGAGSRRSTAGWATEPTGSSYQSYLDEADYPATPRHSAPASPGYRDDPDQTSYWRWDDLGEDSRTAAPGRSSHDDSAYRGRRGRDDEPPFSPDRPPYSAATSSYPEVPTSRRERQSRDRGVDPDETGYRPAASYRDTASYREETTYLGPASQRDTTPSYRDTTPSYLDEPAPYRDSTPSYRDEPAPYRDSTPLYRDETPSYRDRAPSYRDEPAAYRETAYLDLPAQRALPARRALTSTPEPPVELDHPAYRDSTTFSDRPVDETWPGRSTGTGYREDAERTGLAAYRAGVSDYRQQARAELAAAPYSAPPYADEPPARRAVAALPAQRRASVYDVDEDEDEFDDEPEPGGYMASMVYTAMWYAVPMVMWVLWSLTLNTQASANCVDDSGVPCASERTEALATLTHAMPKIGATLLLSILVAMVLRWVSSSWKAATVGFAAAVVGGGLATVGISVITGQPIG